MPPDICRGAGACFCWRLWVPLTCVLLGDISALPVALPAQFTCSLSLCSFSGTQSTGLNQGMPQLLEECICFLRRCPRMGRRWAKEGKDCKKNPPPPPTLPQCRFAFRLQMGTAVLWNRTDYLPPPVFPMPAPLVHIIPLPEIYWCQNPAHQAYIAILSEPFGSV